MTKRRQIESSRAAINAALIWFEDGTPQSERSSEENAVIADMRNAMTLTFNPRRHEKPPATS